MNDFIQNQIAGNAAPEQEPVKACTCKNPHIEPQWSNRSYFCVICGNDYVFDGTTSGKLQDIGTIGKREIGFNPNVSNRFYNFNPRIVLEDGTVIPIAEFKKIQSELEFTTTEIEDDKFKMNATLRMSMPTIPKGSVIAVVIDNAVKRETKELEAKALGFPSAKAYEEYKERERVQSLIGSPFKNYTYNVVSVDTQAPSAVAARPDWDTTFMEVAQVVSKRGTCPRLKVGAVITADNKIISTGYNGAPAGTDHCTEVGCLVETETGRCKRTVHAEINAIIQAGSNMMACNTTLYTTHFPCVECASVIANSDIDKVVYMANNHYDASKTERATEILRASYVDIEEWLPF